MDQALGEAKARYKAKEEDCAKALGEPKQNYEKALQEAKDRNDPGGERVESELEKFKR